MKKISMTAVALALPLVFGTVAADTDTNSLDPMLNATPMSETDLNSVTGGYYYECVFCANTAYVTQVNLSAFSAFVKQKNYSDVYQSIN